LKAKNYKKTHTHRHISIKQNQIHKQRETVLETLVVIIPIIPYIHNTHNT
jgi:hypothetical protein